MSQQSFTTGELFPLPIRTQGDGAQFQLDVNGAMFLLQLTHTDLIATEAFRTGKMELAIYEENRLLFLLYQIDGIFKEGWGDAPLALHLLDEIQQPTKESMEEKLLHLYLVDTRLHTLLAQRKIEMNNAFASALEDYAMQFLAAPLSAEEFNRRLQKIWQEKSPQKMRAKAVAVQEIPLALDKPLH